MHETLRLPVASALRREGYTVVEARDGLAAVQMFDGLRNEIDAVILDLTLPGLSGEGVASETERIKPGVPLIITSAEIILIPEQLTIRQKHIFLQKPYHLRDLVSKLGETLCDAREVPENPVFPCTN